MGIIKRFQNLQSLSCFKPYDVRGRVPDQLNEDIAYSIGLAYAKFLKPSKIVVGYDIRLSSQSLCEALSRGLIDAGVNVSSIGICGTEEIYFATSHLHMDGGIVVTASHNPKDYNGMKFVREESIPISGDTGLKEIQGFAEKNEFVLSPEKGSFEIVDVQQAYIKHLVSFVDLDLLKPLKIVCNAGNGGAGKIIDLIESQLPFDFIKVHHQADGTFPNGVPNPLLPENRQSSIDAIKENKADLGIAWDGDFDRCFFFDENGDFIEGYYIVGLLAESFLKQYSGGRIIHDPRLIWNTISIVEKYCGEAIQCKTGHAFIKERMRAEDAIYGGEMSAHHYFKDFFYCDSGMVPWLLVAQLMNISGKPLSKLVAERIAEFPASGEINRTIADPKAVLNKVKAHYEAEVLEVDYTDGLSMDMGQWRFNLRMSNTEPVVRLNVESKGDIELMEDKTREILELMK
jgi:phosphomannomutase